MDDPRRLRRVEPVTFRSYLLSCVDRNDIIGDISRDVAEDVRIRCLRADSIEGVAHHILKVHYDPPHYSALLKAVHEYMEQLP